MTAQEILALRLALWRGGYLPLPLFGKVPPVYGKNNPRKGLGGWQKLESVSYEQIEMWGKTWPDAGNTGVLAKRVPTLDLDLLNEDAAVAAEDYVRERYEERGYILTRIGRPPKRAILFRTEEPFAKIVVNLVAPNGSAEKIEFLADGQQVVVDGIHPDTGKPYSWHGGKPSEIAREDLPYIREAEASALVAELVDLLVRDFNYKKTADRPGKQTKERGDGAGGGGPADWQYLIDRIRSGESLHDSLRDLSAKLMASNMEPGAVVNFLRAEMDTSSAPHDQRWQDRRAEIPRLVDSAAEKFRELTEASKAAVPAPPSTLSQVIAVFDRWLVLRDHTPIYAVLGAVAANLLPGDPVWLGIIAPPSSAKTEILNSVLRLPHVEPTATLTPPALLSGTPRRQRDKQAKGGLLNKIGEFGILVLKDFGSILSMRPDAKAETVAALREIFDGSWTRHLGTDGGRTLSWKGKLGFVFGATEAYDDYYGVIGSLGDRFLLCRLASSYGGQLKKALDHTGASTKTMRVEIAAAVAGLFTKTLPEPPPLSDAEFQRLDNVVSLAVRLRAHVNRHPYSREIESIHGAEGPGRIGLCLERLLGGLAAIGVPRKHAFRIVEDIALDSTPPIRRHAFEMLTETATETRVIATVLRLPTTTTRRALEDLCAQGLAVRTRGKNNEGQEKKGGADLWQVDPEWADWRANWAATVDHNQKD